MPRTARILAILSCLCPALAAAGEDMLRVYVSIEPLQYFVERVGGDWVNAEVVVGAGQRPETYEPTPRQIAALAQADAFFGVGMPLETAWRRQLRQFGARGGEWVDLSIGLLPEGEADDHDSEHGSGAAADGAHHHHGGMDPHVWLSPANGRYMAGVIADVLSRLDPGHAGLFEANAENLRAELTSLDDEIAALLAAAGVDQFLVYHPAWGHFARDYGLTQIAIESDGKEPGPRSLAGVIREAKNLGVRTIFVDPRHSPRLAETVAEAIDGRLVVLDPLAYDYIDNLRSAAQAIAASRP
jgi:zinc transport system substrate-binding protein